MKLLLTHLHILGASVVSLVAAEPSPESVFPQGSPDEPMRTTLSLAKAAESLDRTGLAWVRKHKCGSCHTGWPYLGSRAVLPERPGDSLQQVRAFFEQRIIDWDADEAAKKHQHREIVGTAAALAMNDAQSGGRLHPVTRQALDRMWTMQRADGAWNWPKCSWPPFEVDDYYGAVLAAVGAGHAPEGYAKSAHVKVGLDKLRTYLKKTPAPNAHHRAWLLWASVRLDGLLDANQREQITAELRALQRSDGGWSMEALGPEWKGREGEKANPDAPSDGYGTGLVVFILRESGVPPDDPAVQRGAHWLKTNQRESGRWFTRSLNGVPQHYLSDAGTVFAVLALRSCGVTPP